MASECITRVTKILEITPHPNPEVERLEFAKIDGWSCIVPKGVYKEGDL